VNHAQPPDRSVTPLRIIAGAMVAGLVGTSAVFAGLVWAGAGPGTTPQLIAPLAGVVALAAVASVALGAAVTQGIAANARRMYLDPPTDDADATADAIEAAYAKASVIALALAEGVGLLGAVAGFVTGSPWFFVAPGAAVVAMGVFWPTPAKQQALLDRVTAPMTEAERRLRDPDAG